MSDRIAEIRERWAGVSVTTTPVRPGEDGPVLAHADTDIRYLLARLSAVTDALAREKLANVIAQFWAATDTPHDAADAVRRHVLEEETKHG